ncbi:hypothetical protein [Hymenobacter sp. B81]|uniref:hypothetical protein n=1 Tax=Hymenobacter sp. B81 TaxID=3344878 RepID=UPI0037DDDAD0
MLYTANRSTGTTAFATRAMKLKPFAGVLVWCVCVASGCAPRPISASEVVVKDSTTRKEIQRLASVSVPGASAELSTRLEYDEKTHRFKPVTFYRQSGHTRLFFSIDELGQVTSSAVSAPWLAQVPVTDTEVTRTRSEARKERVEVPVKAPMSGLAKFCCWFTGLALLATALTIYLRFFSPFK